MLKEAQKSSGVGATAAAGASLLSSFIGNIGQKKAQDRANRHNIQFWEMQNRYNDPQAQMSRLKNAGLNPNLIYGTSPSSAVGNADNIAPAKAAPYDAPDPLKDINQFANVRQTEAQTDNLKEQNNVLAAEALYKDEQTRGARTSRHLNQHQLRLERNLYETSLEARKQNLINIRNQGFGQELDNLIKNKTVKEQVERIKQEVDYLKVRSRGQRLDNDLKKYERQLNTFGFTKNDPIWSRVFATGVQEKTTREIKKFSDKHFGDGIPNKKQEKLRIKRERGY